MWWICTGIIKYIWLHIVVCIYNCIIQVYNTYQVQWLFSCCFFYSNFIYSIHAHTLYNGMSINIHELYWVWWELAPNMLSWIHMESFAPLFWTTCWLKVQDFQHFAYSMAALQMTPRNHIYTEVYAYHVNLMQQHPFP